MILKRILSCTAALTLAAGFISVNNTFSETGVKN